MCVCLYIYIYIVKCSKNQDRYQVRRIFFSIKSIWNTEAKSSQIYKFKYAQVTKKLNHLDHIKWHRRCKSDFLVDKCKQLLYLLCKQLLYLLYLLYMLYLKILQSFLKRYSIIFCRISRKNVQGQYLLLGRIKYL